MKTQYEINERPYRLQEALHKIANWLLKAVSSEPGWDELVLDIKLMSGATIVRITETRGTESYVGSVGPLQPDSAVLEDIDALQRAAYDETEGTWLTASIIIEASGWPTPAYRVGASYNRQDDPQAWDGEGRMTARELRSHLEDFPRAEEYTPEWILERLAGRRQARRLFDSSDFEVPNQYLVTALRNFKPEKLNEGIINVLRTLLGGDVLLDISDSTMVPLGDVAIGPKSEIRYQVLRLSNGMRALCVFSSSEHAQNLRAKQGQSENARLLRETGIKMLLDFVADETCELVVLDPGSDHECFIEKPQAEWVLTVPRNDGVKNALMHGNMEQLTKALMSPSSVLNMGAHQENPYSPVFAPAEGRSEPDTLLLFTSAPEVSALDPQLSVHTLSTVDAFKMADDLGVKKVRLNALNPSATLPISHIRALLEQAKQNQQSAV